VFQVRLIGGKTMSQGCCYGVLRILQTCSSRSVLKMLYTVINWEETSRNNYQQNYLSSKALDLWAKIPASVGWNVHSLRLQTIVSKTGIWKLSVTRRPVVGLLSSLTFWRRNYFFLILAHPVYKMWIIQEPNKLELWNILHFEEKKTETVNHV